MKFVKSFNAFLADEVNLNQSRVDQANEAFDTLTSFLKNADATRDLFIDTSKQGSLRQGTIIKPRKGATEFDVDLLLRCKVMPDWSPLDYLDAIHKAFQDSDRYKDLVDRRGKHRCVTIDYAGDFHVDVVPSIEKDGQCWIMNRDTDEFEITDGDGYAEWFQERSAIVGGSTLVRVVRLLKYLRDEHEWPVKSILLTTMVGLRVDDADLQTAYPDLPTGLRLLLLRLDTYLQSLDTLPELSNPALPQETFTRHWDEDTFEQFRDNIHTVSGQVGSAYDEPNDEKSADKWQDVFGEQFGILDEDLEGGQALADATLTLGATAHAQPVTAIPVSGEALKYTVRLDGAVYNLKGTKLFRGINSNAKVSSGRAIKYKASTGTPEPYIVRWQVVNTGPHAASDSALRGNFFVGHGLNNSATQKLVNWETTKYTGRHWIECFIVKDGVLVGRSGRFYVNIKNPAV